MTGDVDDVDKSEEEQPMILSFHPCIEAEQQVIMADKGLVKEYISLINRAEVIILPQSCSVELYRCCAESSALVFPDYKIRFEYPGKTGQSLLFQKLGFPHPETFRWNSVEEFKKGYLKYHKQVRPFLLKEDSSHEAEGVYMVANSIDLEYALGSIGEEGISGDRRFISQEIIPANGNVLRVVIMGKEIISYWKRPVNDDQVITTAGRGNALIDRNWRPGLQEKGRRQSMALAAATGINLAAVDIVFSSQDDDPEPFFLEINYYFGRRGLGGSLKYYEKLFNTIQEWLKQNGVDHRSINLV